MLHSSGTGPFTQVRTEAIRACMLTEDHKAALLTKQHCCSSISYPPQIISFFSLSPFLYFIYTQTQIYLYCILILDFSSFGFKVDVVQIHLLFCPSFFCWCLCWINLPGLNYLRNKKVFFQTCLFFFYLGKYQPGIDKPDPKTWKANFRCAMNSLPDIEEVKDKSIKKGTNAFRVYKMLSPSERQTKRGQ